MLRINYFSNSEVDDSITNVIKIQLESRRNKMSKELILDAFENRTVERVPTGLWFHFSGDPNNDHAPGDRALFQRTLEGHRKYYRETGLDLVKIMTEGYFVYPSMVGKDFLNPKDLERIEPLSPDDPWILEQLELTKSISNEFGKDRAIFYTLFAPIEQIIFSVFQDGRDEPEDDVIPKLFENEKALNHALEVITDDLSKIAERLLTDAGADGIFVSVRNYIGISSEDYSRYIKPTEAEFLDRMSRVKDNNILHICGDYEGLKNDFNIFKDYNIKAFNWATGRENLSLAEGKKLFGGRAVIGGLSNAPDGVLLSGTKEEVQREVRKLVEENGRTGLIIGADCCLPNGFSDYERVKWVKEVTDQL